MGKAVDPHPRAAFDRFAGTWDEEHGPDSPRAADFAARLDLLGRLCRGRMLEIGCASGLNLIPLAPRLTSGLGVDLSPAMIARARRRAPANLRFEVADALGFLERPPERYDVILFAGVLEHLPERGRVLAACRRWLAADGCVLAIMPYPGTAPTLFATDRHYRPQELAGLAEAHGLMPAGCRDLPASGLARGAFALLLRGQGASPS